MATFYTVKFEDAMEGQVAFATLKEARKAAGGLHPKSELDDGWITKVTVAKLPIRQLLAAVFNREGYAAKAEDDDEQGTA